MNLRLLIYKRGVRRESFSYALTAYILTILSLSLTESEGTSIKRSLKDDQSMKNEKSNINNEFDQSLRSSLSMNNNRNSRALNTFLKNVLQARDELKWIDDAVGGKIDKKETNENISNRYIGGSSLRIPSPGYYSRIRFKRRSDDPEYRDENSWSFTKPSKYKYDNDNPERIYLDDEMKIKRYADLDSELNEQDYRSLINKRGGRRRDDWTNIDDQRNERDTDKGEPTLESLKKTVLDLRKSIENSDKKIDSVNENGGNLRYDNPSFNWYEENEREDLEEPRDSSKIEYYGTNWWEDPRSSVDMFDFKKRDDDEEGDEDDDEDSEPGNSEFDYIMRSRIKREKDMDEDENDEDDDDEGGGEKKVRVYHRAGFGGSYPEKETNMKEKEKEKEKRIGMKEKKDVEKLKGSKNVIRVYREIRKGEGVLDKINDEGEIAVKTEDVKSVDINGNKKKSVDFLEDKNLKIKILGDDNRALNSGVLKSVDNIKEEEEEKEEGEKNKVSKTVRDSNLEDMKKPGLFLSEDKKRSSSLRNGKELEHEPGFSAGEIQRETDSVTKNIKSEIDEPMKNVEIKKEVDKSEPNDDDDVHKLIGDFKDDVLNNKVENFVDKNESKIRNNVEEIKADLDGIKTRESNDEELKSKQESKIEERSSIEDTNSSNDQKNLKSYEADKILKINGDLNEEEKSESLVKNNSELKIEDSDIKKVDSTRKLLWLKDELKNNNNESKFFKRSLKVIDFDSDVKLKQFKKRSLKSYPENFEVIENQKEPADHSEEQVYEIEEDGVSEDDEKSKDPGVNEEGYEKVDKEDKASRFDGDRDPMRDRINMLIKQRLDDRERGRLTHFKREIKNYKSANIEYYDYDNEANSEESDADLTIDENDQQIMPDHITNSTDPISSMDNATNSEPETMNKKDEAAEDVNNKDMEEVKQKEKLKEEFISDTDLVNAQTIKPFGENNENKTNEISNETSIDDQETKLNSSWIGQQAEAYAEEEFGDDKKSLENYKPDDFEGPLEYSVNVHGKLNPESIDTMTNNDEKGNTKEKELASDSENNENENWKYEKIREKGDDDFERDEKYFGKSSDRNNWRYKDSARIEEKSNDEASLENKFKEISLADEDVQSSRDARLVDDSLNQDSLPNMLHDRSESRGLESGEKTYLVIAPPKIKNPRKINENENENKNKNENENENENENSSTSYGSNYLALKITDDMFKGGMEQSNPTEDNISDSNFMGKTTTTTEWKVIDIGDESHLKNQVLSTNKFVKIDTNLGYNDKSRSLEDTAMNLRDVVHESIVDPEEMNGDFDDDTRPRFGRDLKCVWELNKRNIGRNLQSISHEITSLEQEHKDLDEKPADKYLENSQTEFKITDEIRSDKIKKRNSSSDEFTERITTPVMENNTILDSKLKNLEKKSCLVEPGENKTEIDKDKRGLTNVEEWEMNGPTVQKQDPINRNENSEQEILKNLEKRNISELKTIQKSLNPSNFSNTLTTNHEREIRSVKLRDDHLDSDIYLNPDYELGNEKRWKIRRRSKPFHKYYRNINNENRVGYNTNNWNKLGREYRREIMREDKSNGRHYEDASLKKYYNKSFKSKDSGSGEARESLQDSIDSKNHLKNTKDLHKENNLKEVSGNPVMEREKARDNINPVGISHSHTQLQSKSLENTKAEGYNNEAGNKENEKKVLNENAEESSVTVRPQAHDDNNKKKITVLLAADNMEDESQMDLALHGELAGKIVERIFDQVQKNDALKVTLGPGLYRKHKSEDAVASDKIYRQGLDEDEVKHTEGMMRRVMELLGRLILDEVQRKTCASLPPDMREFLQWMLGVEDNEKATDQGPPLPFLRNKEPNHNQDDKFLFEDSLKHVNNDGNVDDIDQINRKVILLKGLINEYNSLSDREKIKVQSVHDYLVKQLGLLLNYIESKESGGNGIRQGVATGDGNILQYQNAVPNSNQTIVSDSTLSPLVNTPSILMLSNASFIEHPALSNHLPHSRFRQTRSLYEEVEREKEDKEKEKDEENEKEGDKEKHKKHKHPKNSRGREKGKRKHKHTKNNKKNKNQNQKHKTQKEISPEYKKLIREAAMLRKKRANLYEDNWDPLDSGYEEPTIYTWTGKLGNERKRSLFKIRNNNDDTKLWADALSGKLEGDEEFDEKKKKSHFNIPDLEIDSNLNFEMQEKEKEKKKRDSKNDYQNGNKESLNTIEKKKKRDVLSASIALQPWLNPEAEYLKDLTNELIHESIGNRDDLMTESRHGQGDDKITLPNKREAWKSKNEQELEEVAFGKDMRGNREEKEEFEKLKEIDRKKIEGEVLKNRKKRDEDSILKNIVEKISTKDIKVRKEPDEHTEKNFTLNYENLNSTINNENENSAMKIKLKIEGDTKPVEKSESITLKKPENELKKVGEKEFKNNENINVVKNDVNKKSKIESLKELETKKQNEKKSSSFKIKSEEHKKVVSKTEKEDQRDISEHVLGFESPLIPILNTY